MYLLYLYLFTHIYGTKGYLLKSFGLDKEREYLQGLIYC